MSNFNQIIRSKQELVGLCDGFASEMMEAAALGGICGIHSTDGLVVMGFQR